jgi:hydrogenase/urease accessory protein HupE
VLAAALYATGAPDASAHAQPFSFLDLRLSGTRLEGNLTAHVFDLAHEIALADPDSLRSVDGIARHALALRAVLAPRLVLIADGDTLRPNWDSLAPAPERNGVTFHFSASWTRVPGKLEVGARLFPYDAQHETYVNIYEGGKLRHQDVFDRDHAAYGYYSGGSQGVLAVVRTFVGAGIHHIFIGPDHILFVIGLLLLGGGLPRLLKIVTAFTVAHSITLALATLKIVQPSPRFIEPAIALSIVYVGLENLRVRPGQRDRRAWIAFGFGFVHGFGFASVLREFGLPQQALGWSLASFNLGVELGQACIVGAAAPVLAWASARSERARIAIVRYGSIAVALAGTYWFFERVFFAH